MVELPGTLESTSSFAAALQSVVERVRDISGAGIVALYPYDQESDSFYAPVATGLPHADVVKSLPDLADQLRRFRVDQAEGKIGPDLGPADYGPSAWLLATQRPLISTNATNDLSGTFVRRHHIEATVGLPLLVGTKTVGLLLLNYTRDGTTERPDIAAPSYLQSMTELAQDSALILQAAHDQAERSINAAVTELVGDLLALPMDSAESAAVNTLFERAIRHVAAAVQVSAGALYILDQQSQRYLLLAAYNCPSLTLVPAFASAGEAGLTENSTLYLALAEDELFPIAARNSNGTNNRVVLLLADRDELALGHRLPAVDALLGVAADIFSSMVGQRHLVEALDESSRTLSAVTRLGTRLLSPGATQARVLDTAVRALTDSSLAELDFDFATIFLLDVQKDGSLAVVHNSGSTSVPAIDSTVIQPLAPAADRVPAWITNDVRSLAMDDIVAYVATRRRAVVVEAQEATENNFVAGYPESGLERLEVQIAQPGAGAVSRVRAVRVRELADRAPMQAVTDTAVEYRPTDEFTLDAELFRTHRHGELVRVFMPFGPIHNEGGAKRATGVLEAGYHMQHRRRLDRVQIEALRACATTLAVAVETARLYEDVTVRARQLEIVSEVSRSIATSIDLDQTLALISENMARSINTSLCLIALLEDDGSAWYGAAASDMNDSWIHRRVERPERSIVFETADRNCPIVVEDANDDELVSGQMARLLGIQSLLALPLTAGETPIGAVILAERGRRRTFTAEEVETGSGLAAQAAMAIRNARQHFREEEEQHIQKDLVLVGFGQWGQKAYQHLLLLKSFFNFRIHVVESDRPGRRDALGAAVSTIETNGDVIYWDSPSAPAREALALELEPSCYVVTYIVTPAETHLPMLKMYYDLSNVVLIEKPLGAAPETYREFLDRCDGTVEIVAADHYWFKMEVRLLQLLLTEERNLRAFLDEIEEVEIEILEEQAPGGSGAQIGMIADLIPHAFAILSLLTPLDHLKLDDFRPLQIGRYQPLRSEHETYARLAGCFDHRGRRVRVTIDVGKGVADLKSIKLVGQRRLGGRRSFYKFDFARGEAMDGTQGALRAAIRPIRQPGVRDNAHLSMLRHVIEKKHPAVGILSIREALRANARIQQLEQIAAELLESGQWLPYEQGQRPDFDADFYGQAQIRPALDAISTSTSVK